MNKLSILLLGVLAAGFTACEDAPEVAPVQSNPQPPMYEDSQISCAKAGVLASTAVVDLDSYKTSDEGVPVVSFTTTDAFPEGAYPSGVLQISKTEDFASHKDLNVDVTDGTGYVLAYEWNTAMTEMFGRAHKEHEIYYRLAGYVHQDGGVYHIGNADTYLVSGTANVIGIDEGVAISEAYYFLGDCTTWTLSSDAAADYKMYHSSADPMDDPIFRFYFNISESQSQAYWKIAPQEAINEGDNGWGQVFGPEEDGNTNPSGLVIEDGKAGRIVGAGTYCIEFDAISLSYNIYKTSVEEPYLFTPGGANGWNMYSSQWLAWVEGRSAYYAPIKVDNEVKFVDIVRQGTGGPSWDNTNYGGSDGTLEIGGGNITTGKTAIYFAVADTKALTYSLTEVTSIGLIGVGGDWDNDIELTPSQDLLQWSATVDLSGDWKVRFNHGWDFNYGNAPDDLVFDGGNIGGYDGKYTVTFDMSGNLPRLIITQ